MPELPEVETVCRGIEERLTSRTITDLTLTTKGLRFPFPKKIKQDVKGQQLLRINRRAKYILMYLSNAKIIILHLGMSGVVSIINGDEKYRIKKHDHVIFKFDDNSKLVLNDARRFGSLSIANENELNNIKPFNSLGPEPLGNEFNAEYLFNVLRKKKSNIKSALMDQRVVSGLGNIYVCESLYYSDIHPERAARTLERSECEKLIKAIRDVLIVAIEAGGSTLKDYRHTDGELGYFQHQFAVYDRVGESCRNCQCDIKITGGVKRIIQSGRSSFYCPERQKNEH